MDGSNIENNSDSDSGESWTLLDHSPAYADEVPDLSENPPDTGSNLVDTNEKDEDTDGISIISDSDPESMTPCEISYEKLITNESRPTDHHNTQYISVNPLTSNSTDLHESIGSKDDFLGDTHGKHRTYVHRRNKRLSTVLNIIMLGSVITAAGVAIGHMWGAKHECTVHTTPSVNKILSNLYKLQEENAYLRNKLKELTLATNIQMLQRKATEKLPYKHRCKKVYEESLNNKNADKGIKCLDNDRNILESHLVQPAYEKEFLHDMDRLKLAYQQNKSWLDDEVARRLKNEEHSVKRMKNSLKSTNLIKIDEEPKKKNFNDLKTPESESIIESIVKAEPLSVDLKTFEDNFPHNNGSSDKKISYADSLKSDQQGNNLKKKEINDEPEKYSKEVNKRVKKNKTYNEIEFANSASEEELKKDDRYVGRKSKQERKKHDRQKLHKKQKRKNKYDIWDIKGDVTDYDEFSVTSSQENDFILAKPDKNILSRDFEKANYINQFAEVNTDNSFENVETVDFKGKPDKHKKNAKFNKKGDKNKELNWYEKRAAFRTEARKRLEHELFGESSPNDAAGWYFRRVRRREQCRAKGDNSTHRRLSKRAMNYKVKH